MGIVGGVGSVTGAVLGALYMVGLPNLFGGSDLVTLLVGSFGLMILVLFLPGGLIELVHRVRDALLVRYLTPRDAVPADAPAEQDPPAVVVPAQQARSTEAAISGNEPAPRVPGGFASSTLGPRALWVPPAAPALLCTDVEVRFGGLVANSGVHLRVDQGEVVGLIGTNGAGKSTLMNAVGGYVRVSGGTIEVFGQDVTSLPSHERAKLGIGRVFQDAKLFGELTVRDCILVALEARDRTEFLPTLLGLPPATHSERVKNRVADDLVDLTGLGRYAQAYVGELSTGTRRIVELACLVAGGSRLLLLDEPTGGVAQREVEAFAAVLRDVHQQLQASILLIEHDMPLVMSLSDRIVCMTAGQVIAEGPPDDIRNDPAVIAAYLGTDERAIERSDSLPGGRRG
jgi:ABC-type branched-subunit amino acid transport system ATPase component